VVFELEGVEVEFCRECRGVWLDAGEVEQICADPEGHAPKRLTEALDTAQETKAPDRRRCPSCHRRLRSVRLPGDPDVVIDRCPKGHGFWFDRGELETLVETYREGNAGTVAKFLHEVFRHDLEVQSKEVHNE
jgi:Zn-finger nucleic acid-binding protein